jgi:trans-2-enoyl-CoA reductase
MFSRSAARAAIDISRSNAPIFLKARGAPATRQRRGTPSSSLPGVRRYISVYGYTQAKALVYSRYGEPKDVLQ